MYVILVETSADCYEYVKAGTEGDETAVFSTKEKAAEIALLFLESGDVVGAEVVCVN